MGNHSVIRARFLKTSNSVNPRVKSPNPGLKFNPRLNCVPQTPISANPGLNCGLNLTHSAGWINSLIDRFAQEIEQTQLSVSFSKTLHNLPQIIL